MNLSPPPEGAEWSKGLFVLNHVETFVLFPEFTTAHGRPNASPGPLFVFTGREGDPQTSVRVIADPSAER